MAVNDSQPINHRRSRLPQTDRTRAISAGLTCKRNAKSLLLLSAVCLFELGCAHPSQPARLKIPLGSCSDLPCVDATFGGTKLKLLISLADQNSYLTPAGALKADAHRTAKEFGRVRQFKLGSVQLSDIFAIDDTFNEALAKAPETLTPPVDGSLSYNAFNERLLILNIPGHEIEVSAERLKSAVCSGICSQLQDSRAADTGDIKTLTTDGFALGNLQLRARLDSLFRGSVAILEPMKGLRLESTRSSDGLYRGSKLSLLETEPVYFQGKPVANSAPVFRADDMFGIAGIQFDSAVGLSILSTGAYAFDFRSMKMWRYQ